MKYCEQSFEDKVIILIKSSKPCCNVKDFLLEDCQRNFLTTCKNSYLPHRLILAVE